MRLFYALKMNKNPEQFEFIHFWKSPNCNIITHELNKNGKEKN
jgi:hypothetical protein